MMDDEEIDELVQDLLSGTEHCPARDVIAAGLIANQRDKIAQLEHDLAEAVGYRLAVSREAKGDQDHDG